MLNRKVIRPLKSPYASSIMLVAKANGKVRFCVDYWELNDRTKKWSYSLLKINDVLKYLGGSLYYSTLDMTETFWSIPIKEKNKEKTDKEDVECTPMPKPNVGHKRVTQKINALSDQDSVRITDNKLLRRGVKTSRDIGEETKWSTFKLNK